jgi:hypothetical protein
MPCSVWSSLSESVIIVYISVMLEKLCFFMYHVQHCFGLQEIARQISIFYLLLHR